MTWLLTFILAVFFGGQAQQTPPPAPVAHVQSVTTTAPLPSLPSLPVLTTNTVNDAACPNADVTTQVVNQVSYPTCAESATDPQTWACISYLPSGDWTVQAMSGFTTNRVTGLPELGALCADNPLGVSGIVNPNAVTNPTPVDPQPILSEPAS